LAYGMWRLYLRKKFDHRFSQTFGRHTKAGDIVSLGKSNRGSGGPDVQRKQRKGKTKGVASVV